MNEEGQIKELHKDLLAFKAIEDAKEESSSPKCLTGTSNNKVTTGCMVVCAFTVIAIGLAIFF